MLNTRIGSDRYRNTSIKESVMSSVITPDQKKEIIKIFDATGFRYFKSGKWFFTGSRKKTTANSFYTELNFPGALEAVPALQMLDYLWTKKQFPHDEFSKIVTEYSVKYLPESQITSIAAEEMADKKVVEEELEDMTEYIRSLVPTINVGKGAKDRVILLDPHRDHRPAIDIDPELYMMLLELDLAKLMVNPEVLKVMTCFDPYNLKNLFVRKSKSGSITSWHVNYYVAPHWRHQEVMPAYDGFIKTLIDHLFPNELEKEYVLDWLHYAIAYRNDTLLSLIGARGTGKGILLGDILSLLIGEDYREIVNQEILTEKFNGAFKNKRYVFFDEVDISGDRELNRVRAFCNNTIAVEKKGEDSETIDNYTSIGLTSNNKKEFRVEPQERRFSVPEVTEVPLLKIVSEDEVEDFCRRIRDPENTEIAAFGNFLLQRKPKNSSRLPLRGKYFFDLCRLSMPEWKLYIIEYIINEGEIGERILNSTLVKKFKKVHGEHAPFATKKGSIETFLLDYFHEGQCRIGKIVDAWDPQRSRDTFGILPDEEFLLKYGKKYKTGNEIDAL
jgi:hypothetical protein